MILKQIGVVRSPVTEGVDEGWGSVTSEVVIDQGYAQGLIGLDSFSHILVVFYMHKYTFDASSDLVRKPRGRSDMPEVGVFAQRAKHRPNPIGITAVKLLNVEGNVVTVKGLDAIDGTPVLDVKPYFPAFDKKEADNPRWVYELMKNYF